MTPDPEFLFLTNSHREALAGITYAILERKGFAVLTGEAGTGKTTLLSLVMGTLSQSSAYFGWILNPLLTTSELFELTLLDLGVAEVPASKARRIVELHKFLLKASEENKTTVLIIDEAHKLDPQLLEEIRLLTNFESGNGKLLQIILAGQSELDDLLERHDLRQLKQRISVRLTVDPLLNAVQVGNYIAHRWNRAGAEHAPPFTKEAVALIDRLSRGVPRIVNAICDAALLDAFAEGNPCVGAQGIAAVASDLRLSISSYAVASAGGDLELSAPPNHQPVERPDRQLAIPEVAQSARWTDRFGFKNRKKKPS